MNCSGLKPMFLEICTKNPNKIYSPPLIILPQVYVHSSLKWLVTLYLPYKVIQRRFGVVIWCLEWECCTLKRMTTINSNPPILNYGSHLFKNYFHHNKQSNTMTFLFLEDTEMGWFGGGCMNVWINRQIYSLQHYIVHASLSLVPTFQ